MTHAASVSAPIFVLASGQRCGSTLLQRFLCTHPQMLIWGEHDGVLREMFAGFARLHEWNDLFGHHYTKYQASGVHRNFVANLNPPRPTIREAQINLVQSYWQAPAAAIGKPIWGFKEVLYDAQMALTLKDLFPTAKIIYITRHPFKCFTSLLHEERLKPGETYVPLKEIWTRNRTIEALNHWVRINRSFLETPGLDGDWLYQMTCEQLVADIPGKTRDLIAWLGLQPDDFDYSLFDYKIYTDRHSNEDDRPTLTWADLSAEEYTLLTSDDVLSVTQRLGYAMPAPRHKPSTPGMY